MNSLTTTQTAADEEAIRAIHQRMIDAVHNYLSSLPADAVMKVLKEKPAIAGIAVPGMPMGSPGMEVPGGQKEAFNIVAFDKAGKTSVYQKR